MPSCHIDVDVPQISIELVGRTLKAQASQRLIPLVGVSLWAFRVCPNGCLRYAGSPNLSATDKKFLRENGLVESSEHMLCGLRDSFEDRMLTRDVDERIRRDVMGHSLNRGRYGAGASLEKLAGIIELIALSRERSPPAAKRSTLLHHRLWSKVVDDSNNRLNIRSLGDAGYALIVQIGEWAFAEKGGADQIAVCQVLDREVQRHTLSAGQLAALGQGAEGPIGGCAVKAGRGVQELAKVNLE